MELEESTNSLIFPNKQHDTSPKHTISSSQLLHNCSTLSGMPEMDTRTVMSSVHDKANIINSSKAATTHSCLTASGMAEAEHDATVRNSVQGSEFKLMAAEDPLRGGEPYIGFKSLGFDANPTYLPTAADTIFHMHACDDEAITDSMDNMSFQHQVGSHDTEMMDTTYPPNALRKVAEKFQRNDDDLFLSTTEFLDDTPFPSKQHTLSQQQSSSVDEMGSDYFDSFYDHSQYFPSTPTDSSSIFRPQFIAKDFCLDTDSDLLDNLIASKKKSASTHGSKHVNADDFTIQESEPGKNPHMTGSEKLQPAESTKVVAELLAELLDDVDVPYYMNEIESGVTSTPDGKEVAFICEPSSLSVSNSWTPPVEENSLLRAKNMGNTAKQSTSKQEEENMICKPGPPTVGLPMPPPPPPLPILPAKETASNLSLHPQAVKADADSDLVFRKLAKIIEDGDNANNSITLVSICHNQVVPLIQEGPCCGLVALTMAKDMMGRTDVSFEDILKISISRRYTNNGEMFSAFDMGALAREVYGCECEVLDMETTGSRELLLRHLVGGNICLVPYDADSNHEPCMKKGHKSHWTLLTGILFVLPSATAGQLRNDFVVDKMLPQLYHVHERTSSETLQQIIHIANRDNILVYGRQGKSRHTGLWSLGALLSSNSNLVEVGPQKTSEVDFVLPDAGIAQTLCNKIVIMYK